MAVRILALKEFVDKKVGKQWRLVICKTTYKYVLYPQISRT